MLFQKCPLVKIFPGSLGAVQDLSLQLASSTDLSSASELGQGPDRITVGWVWLVEIPSVSELVLSETLRSWRILGLGSCPHLYLTTLLIHSLVGAWGWVFCIAHSWPFFHVYFSLLLHVLPLGWEFSLLIWALPILEGPPHETMEFLSSAAHGFLSPSVRSVFLALHPFLDLARLWLEWVITRCFHYPDAGEPWFRLGEPDLRPLLSRSLEMWTWGGPELSDLQFTPSNGYDCEASVGPRSWWGSKEKIR